jgi:hypothetical protein
VEAKTVGVRAAQKVQSHPEMTEAPALVFGAASIGKFEIERANVLLMPERGHP